MILEANFTESNHELPCDPTVAVVVNEGGGGEVPNAHINNKNNPHQVTAEQVGAVAEEQLAEKVADAIQEEWENGGYLIDTIDMVAWSAGYSATDSYLQEYGFSFVDEEGNTVRNVPTYEEVDAQIGSVETALDGIIAIQNELIGGDGV